MNSKLDWHAKKRPRNRSKPQGTDVNEQEFDVAFPQGYSTAKAKAR